MIDAYSRKYTHGMKFEENVSGVLEIIFCGPNLNAVDARLHVDIPEFCSEFYVV